MPDIAGLRRLTLADLDQATLEQLVAHGEDLLVERKRALPIPPKFGAAVGSFANTLGGWLLIGSTTTGPCGLGETRARRPAVPPRRGAACAARPAPPFVSTMREIAEKPIAVMRVFASVDSPHIVRGSGAVYLRSSKGKEPVDDHRTLLDLARRGEDAEALA